MREEGENRGFMLWNDNVKQKYLEGWDCRTVLVHICKTIEYTRMLAASSS
jgi:hypothetical protein